MLAVFIVVVVDDNDGDDDGDGAFLYWCDVCVCIMTFARIIGYVVTDRFAREEGLCYVAGRR